MTDLAAEVEPVAEDVADLYAAAWLSPAVLEAARLGNPAETGYRREALALAVVRECLEGRRT